VNIAVTGTADLAGGTISSGTTGGGNGGTVTFQAGSLTVDGSSAGISTAAGVSGDSPLAVTGKGGNVTVTVTGTSAVSGANGNITLENGGLITASGYTTGLGGTVTVDQSNSLGTDSFSEQGIDIQGSGSGITATINGTGSSAAINSTTNPYAVNVSATTLTIIGGQISSSTYNTGNAGNLSVTAKGGAVAISASGEISSGTTDSGDGSGKGGDLTLSSGSLTIDGSGIAAGQTGIFSTTSLSPGDTAGLTEGYAGNITVTVNGQTELTNGGQISSGTSAGGATPLALAPSGHPQSGDGGEVNLKTGNLLLEGTGTEVSAAATANGNGGDISITTNDILNEGDQATITASSLQSNAGNITVNADQLIMQNSSIDTSASALAGNPLVGNGGSIHITVGHLIYLLNSKIVTKATNKGGNITIDPEFVILGNSLISAAGGAGDGNIIINANFLLSSGSTIDATGSVTIDSIPLDLAGSLLPLPAELTSEEKRLRESCARSIGHEFSSLIVVGRGGTETGPQELRPDFGLIPAQPSLRPSVEVNEQPLAPTVP
jgi:hypothetical protein